MRGKTMKQETKELVDWIKKQINIAKTNNIDPAWNGQHEAYNDDYKKAMAFLDSLPGIESHLTRGGYIQDKNGTPCCEGDLIKVTNDDGSYEVQGNLTWENYCFCLYDEKGLCNHILCPSYIYEKVK